MTDIPVLPLESRVQSIEKQIDRLRKEVDDRIGSNHTLWRAGLAGMGALILLQKDLDFGRALAVVPLLGMVLAAYWLNQMVTFYRIADSLAFCEQQINKIFAAQVLDHELTLFAVRRRLMKRYRPYMWVACISAVILYWYALSHTHPNLLTNPLSQDALPMLIASIICNIAAVANFVRFVTFGWPAMTRETSPEGYRDEA